MKKGLAIVLVLMLVLSVAAVAFGATGSMTLNPISAGDETNLSLTHGGIAPELRFNWGANTTDDGDISYVSANGNEWTTDLYNLQDPAIQPGTITAVKVYIKARAQSAVDSPRTSARTTIKTGSNIYNGLEITLGTTYEIYETTYNTNPATGLAWTWGAVSDLQTGVTLRRVESSNRSMCTKVWVVVEYETATCERYGLGYWKNHTEEWPTSYAPGADFFDSEYTWLSILDEESSPGDAYIILAKQYIAAVLNVANGCTPPTEVSDAILDAEYIFEGYNPGVLDSGTEYPEVRQEALDLKDILDYWNNPED